MISRSRRLSCGGEAGTVESWLLTLVLKADPSLASRSLRKGGALVARDDGEKFLSRRTICQARDLDPLVVLRIDPGKPGCYT
jgi:hypothetical protein